MFVTNSTLSNYFSFGFLTELEIVDIRDADISLRSVFTIVWNIKNCILKRLKKYKFAFIIDA